MKDKKLDQLKKEYQNIPIPPELDFVVKKALRDGGTTKGNRLKRINKVVASVVASVVLLMAAVNVSPAVATTAAEVPVVGSIIKVLTFRNYTFNEDKFHADINVPKIEGLDNKALENSLNEKYLKENEQLYKQFMTEMKELKQQGGGYSAVNSGYQVKTDNERILSVARYVVVTKASATETVKYDTIDKQKQVLITLPSLFKDDSYIDIISQNIKEQMQTQMQTDEGKIYWINVPGEELLVEPFETISPEQNFYINPEGKLVVAFDEYQVAPGYMGTPEFIIPTEVIADILVGDQYIK
ncbi:DUF3298 domain-containing protein [Peptococcaceae bacterium 1198_IL3148]